MKAIRYLYVLLPLMFLLAACDSEDDTGEPEGGTPVEFGGDNIFKTLVQGQIWAQGDEIGIYMMEAGQPVIAENAANRKYISQNGFVYTTNFEPASGNTIWFPQDGRNVDFIAYYPYKETGTGENMVNNNMYPVDITDQGDFGDIDMLYSTNATGRNKDNTAVNLEFYHKLSKLRFYVRPGDGLTANDFVGGKLEVSNFYRKGSLNLMDGSFSNLRDIGTVEANETFTIASDMNPGRIDMIVIPQDLNGCKLIITRADTGEQYEWLFTTPRFEEGKLHQYIITVSRTGITVDVDNITDWQGKDEAPVEGGTSAWQIGDYYPDPGNPGTAIGVIYWLDPSDSRHGRIISLDQASTAWAASQAAAKANPRDSDNGRVNMRMIYEIDPAFTDFPALQWVHAKNPPGTDYSNPDGRGIWYLAANKEYLGNTGSFYEAIGVYGLSFFNNKLTAAGGTTIINNYYWASDESGDDGMKCVNLQTGLQGRIQKVGRTCISRAILAF